MDHHMKKYSNPRIVNPIGGIVVFDDDEGGERHLDPGTPDHVQAIAGAFGPVEPYIDPQDAPARPNAALDRAAFCKALRREGILTVAEAVLAAQGGWPDVFSAFGLTDDEEADAQIDWAAATEIRYHDQLPQLLALHHAGGNSEAATAILDTIFGID